MEIYDKVIVPWLSDCPYCGDKQFWHDVIPKDDFIIFSCTFGALISFCGIMWFAEKHREKKRRLATKEARAGIHTFKQENPLTRANEEV